MTPEVPLERAEFFRALAPDRLARIRPLLSEKRFERQDVLFFEGEPAEFLWVVGSGAVRLYKSSSDGTVTTLELLDPGEVFGFDSALGEPSYTASVESMGPGMAFRLSAPTALRLTEECPEISRELLSIVSRRLRDAQERVRSFAHDPAPTRLARALLGAVHGSEAHVTRRNLAEASGTTVETAIRVLRRMERDAIIHSEVRHVTILDPAALRRMAGEA